MKKNRWIVWLICLLAIALTLALGSMLPRSWYYLTSTLMILELLVPFFLAFEGRKPQARELVLIAVLCALAVAGRVAIPIPNFKAIFAIVMITGIAFGPETGFLVGAVSALTSNFFYSQGPFTPWQMLAYGMGGMVFGLLFRRLPRQRTPPGCTGGSSCHHLRLFGRPAGQRDPSDRQQYVVHPSAGLRQAGFRRFHRPRHQEGCH